jgi:hypothetical protein
MKQEQEDNFCDFETSLALKELGFNELCYAFYSHGKKIQLEVSGLHKNTDWNNCLIKEETAPTWLDALVWLEGKGTIFEFKHTDQLKSEVVQHTKSGDYIEVYYSNSILSAIQSAVKECINILKGQNEKHTG